MKKRTKKQYQELFDNPSALFGDAEVLLFPNGESEIWIRDKVGKLGMRLRASRGPAGLRVELTSFPGTPKMDVFGDTSNFEIVQYDGSKWSEDFRAWYRGEGPHPGEKEKDSTPKN